MKVYRRIRRIFTWIFVSLVLWLIIDTSSETYWPIPFVEDINITASNKTLLTIFTTFKHGFTDTRNLTHHEFAHKLVIPNWSSFTPYVRPVLFSNCSDCEVTKLAGLENWDVLPMQRVNNYNTPFLKEMYQKVFDDYDSTFYGFANGDVLFAASLIATLRLVKKNLHRLRNNVLIIGRRTNVVVTSYSDQNIDEYEIGNLRELSDTRGELLGHWAIDYFFLTKENSINWKSFFDVVIGRVKYDNYFVAKALSDGVYTIDVSKTCLAVHISKNGVCLTGLDNVDKDYNGQVLGDYKFWIGSTSAAQFSTEYCWFHKCIYLRSR